MSHLEKETMRRVLGGLRAPQEVEAAAEHIVSCDRCQALAATLLDELRAEQAGLRGEGPLQLVFDLIDRERHWGVATLSAIAEWAELQRMASRRSQRERVRMTKACHTIAFFRLVLDDLKEASSWDDAEFLAGLALLSVEAMSQRQQITQPVSNDLQAELWTAVANSRRRAAEWQRAHQALKNAERHLKEGSGVHLLQARLLSVTASVLADQGHVSQAVEALEKCRVIYDRLREWTLLARALVKMANILAGTEPSKSLVALDHAWPLIPAGDSELTLFAEMLRVECLIETSKPSEALRVYRRSFHLLAAMPQVRTRIRGKFTGARLLDALGFGQQAERLFNEVVERDVEHELYKDAFLDLLYLYGRHMKMGDLEKAARVCQRALTDSFLSEVEHEQLRTLWSQLLDAAQHQPVGEDILRELRQYLSTHWKHPAAIPPVLRRVTE